MKKIEFYLNVIHYCIYKAHNKLHLLFNKINPFWLLAEIPFFKKRHEQLGIDVHKEINKAFNDKNFGLSMTVAGGVLLVLLFLFFFGFFGIFIKLLLNEKLSAVHFVIYVMFSVILCYIFVFKNDKYIKYFNKFDTWTKKEKPKYVWFSLIITILVILLFIMGW